MNIIALCQTPWEGPWLNRQQLLSRLGRSHTVLYSRGAWTVWDRHDADWRNAPWLGRFEQRDNVILDHPGRWLLRWPKVTAFDRLVVRADARRWLRRLGRKFRRPLTGWVFDPCFFPYLEFLPLEHLVYHAYDYYSDYPGWSDTLEAWQYEILARSDAAFASSRYSAARLSEKSGRPVDFLPNGVDYETFATAEQTTTSPDDLRGIPHPRLGYTGRINRKVDLSLIDELASRRPDWHFVIVGGLRDLDEATAAAASRCRERANVHLLGEKDPGSLPAYISRMDVNLMCYRHGPGLWTEGIYPLKLHEYLAAGAPVVSSDLESVREFSDVVHIVSGADEWESAIAAALANSGRGNREARRSVAARNSWDARLDVLEDRLRSLATGA